MAAALIAGLAIYVPIFGLRGALFCLMPGIAWRSWRLAGFGILGGMLAEVPVLLIGDWGWNSRENYCGILVQYLPPYRSIVFPEFSPLPNAALFVLGLAFWAGIMFTIWYGLWPGRKSKLRYGIFVVAAGLGVAGSAIWLWSTAPDGFSGYRASSPADDLVARRFLLFPYLIALPPALAFAGWTLAKTTSSSESDCSVPRPEAPTADQP